MIRLLVCGGRAYADRARLFKELDELNERDPIGLVIHGGAPGADDLAESWANAHSIPTRWFRADWETHGRAAGPLRNQRMLDEGKPDLVVAFPGGRGTADMIHRAELSGVSIIVVKEKA